MANEHARLLARTAQNIFYGDSLALSPKRDNEKLLSTVASP